MATGLSESGVMLGGQLESVVDPKGRLAMPQHFRRHFGETVTVLRWDHCLMVLGPENFEKIARHVASRQTLSTAQGIRSFFDQKAQRDRRHFFGSVYELNFDAQGRLTIPKGLRDSHDLYSEVMWVGCGEYVELWAMKHWVADCARWEEAGGYREMFADPPLPEIPSAPERGSEDEGDKRDQR